MKHYFLILTFLFSALQCIADTFTSNGIRYEVITNSRVKVIPLDDNYYPIEKYKGDIVIPASVEYNGTSYAVVEIGEKAFYNNNELTSVSMPNTIQYIDDKSFYKVPITEITLSKNLIEIGVEAFALSSITNIVFPNTLKKFGSSCFWGCPKLTSIIIPDKVETIGWSAFDNCESLETVYIGSGVSEIDDYAFLRSPKLQSITVSSSNKSFCDIDGVLFNKSKTSILCYPAMHGDIYTIPETVKTIEIACFAYLESLKQVVLPYGLETISYSAFEFCSNLNIKNFPKTITSFKDRSFSYCKSLTSVSFGPNIREIEGYCFEECTSLETVVCEASYPPYIFSETFPSSVERYGTLFVPKNSLESYKADQTWGEFNNIEPIASYVYDYDFEVDGIFYKLLEGLPNPTAEVVRQQLDNNYLYSGSITVPESVMVNGHTVSIVGIGEWAFAFCDIVEVNLPNTIYNIADCAFTGCNLLMKINIPNQLGKLGDAVFEGCTILDNITLPNTILHLGDGCFYDCSSLTSFEWPASVTKIPKSTFSNCTNLESVKLPESVYSIGDRCFDDCPNIKDITCLAKRAPSVGYSVFDESIFNSCTLHIYDDVKDNYLASDVWSKFLNIDYLEGAGIEDIFIDDDTKLNVYDFNGKLVLSNMSKEEAVNYLTPGLYIIGGKKVFIK